MPFTKTWSEEIVAEWLLLEGYLIEIGLPVSSTVKGGRYEADVLGAKVEGDTLRIIQVEVGQLAGGQSSIASLKKKFSDENVKAITRYFKDKFAHKRIDYEKKYVATFWTEPIKIAAQKIGISVRPLPDFLRQEVLTAIEAWKNEPKSFNPKYRGPLIMLPEAYWLLQFLDYLHRKKMMKEESH